VTLKYTRHFAASVVGVLLLITGCSGGGSSTDGKAATGDGGGGSSAASQQGAVSGALSFKPENDGFSFENYGNVAGRPNLTPVEMRRYFGDGVCASMADGVCTLTPPARQWMESTNEGMNGGHCEGMAALALLINRGQLKAADFGADSTYSLKIDGNDKLANEIAYWFATQAIDPTASAEIKTLKPSEVVAKLRDSFAGSGDSYTMGIYKTEDGRKKDGHAITPYAISDLGGGKVQIVLYDNNYPNVARALDVDTNTEIWTYNTSTNPSEPTGLYQGDATTGSLTLTPTSSRTGEKVCPFCGNDGAGAGGGVKGSAASTPVGYLFMDQAAGAKDVRLRVTAEDGSPLTGLRVIEQRNGGTDEIPPIYQVPADKPFKVVIDGSAATGDVLTDITYVGAGEDLYVDGIQMEHGQVDTAVFDPVANAVTYETTSAEAPTFGAGFTADGADYEFAVGGVDLPSGGKARIAVDRATGALSVTNLSAATGTYSLSMNRYDDTSTQSFFHDGIDLTGGATLSVGYAAWNAKTDHLGGQITGPNGTSAVTFDTDR
jgi:hypothetical protein